MLENICEQRPIQYMVSDVRLYSKDFLEASDSVLLKPTLLSFLSMPQIDQAVNLPHLQLVSSGLWTTTGQGHCDVS